MVKVKIKIAEVWEIITPSCLKASGRNEITVWVYANWVGHWTLSKDVVQYPTMILFKYIGLTILDEQGVHWVSLS